MKSLPSLPGLSAFDAVARHLSFSRAAKELHVTQAAVSHRIRSLEDELGVALFARTSRKVQLTLPGQTLFRSTEGAFSKLREGLAEMEAVANPLRITVSCSPSFAIRWLVPHLGLFREFAPDLEIRIAAEDRIVDPGIGGIDACIRFGPGGYSGVHCELLSEEHLGAVCSPHLAVGLDLQSPADLLSGVLLHDDVLATHDQHVGWAEWLMANDVTPPKRFHGPRFSHSHMALDAAVASQGIALARHSLVRRELETGSLVAPFGFGVPSGFNYWLIRAQDVPPTKAMNKFESWVKTTIGEEHGHPK